MTEDLITTFNISLVVRGSVRETSKAVSGGSNDDREDPLRYAVAKAKGVYKYVVSGRGCLGGGCLGGCVGVHHHTYIINKRH